MGGSNLWNRAKEEEGRVRWPRQLFGLVEKETPTTILLPYALKDPGGIDLSPKGIFARMIIHFETVQEKIQGEGTFEVLVGALRLTDGLEIRNPVRKSTRPLTA